MSTPDAGQSNEQRGPSHVATGDLFGRLHAMNASVMWLSRGESLVCYLVPDDADSDAAYLATSPTGIVIEINLPRATALNGYEAYLRQGYSPPNSVVSANSVCSLTPETPRKDKPN